ncbi:cytochrome P450 [Rhizobium puerariae]|uniref:Cytochrome P450 n=1 Tax=Rhizobium puerariae TaxID=1585791 RepID=A0ABV6AJA8_9HYPH
MTVQSVTVGENVHLAELFADPYPTYAKLREKEPVCFVPAANRYLVTRHADIVQLERDPETFSANEAQSLMKRVMGHTMLRKDGAVHKRERVACEAALRPNVIRGHWMPVFQSIVDDLIDRMIEKGETADLFDSFAAPCASRALAALLGLTNVPWQNLAIWSQAMMDGTGNYGNDAEIWRRSDEAAAGVDAALDEMIPYLQKNPDNSIISAMLHAADPLNREEIAANVKVIIGGGLNEPRDAIGTAVAALLENPDQRAQAEADPAQWRNVFEETVRWVSPIGMYPRQTTKRVELGGTVLEEGARIGVVLASGNRDEAVFENAEKFDINREKKPHVAFGGGPHFCLGTWAARVQVGEVALPTLFRRLKGLRQGEGPVTWAGWVFRGPTSVPVAWTN